MTRILFSLLTIGAVSAIAFGGTMAYFSDSETSTGNTFSAGEIDLKIDLSCDYRVGCGFPLKDLNYDPLFYDCDLKPGDSHSSTLSFHVYNNNAWGRIRFPHIYNYEYGCTEPESEVDSTCASPGDGQGELDDNLYFTIWQDEGQVTGWQCPESHPKCAADPKEGDGQQSASEPVLLDNVAVSSLPSEIAIPDEIIASNTYYFGVRWTVPDEVGNIIQSDSLNGMILMDVVQSRNNPDRIFP